MSGADERVARGVRLLTVEDAGQLLTLQLAAWVLEAHANETLAIPPLHESLSDVAGQLLDDEWRIWGVVEDGRLIATARNRILPSGAGYIGRLGVVPDLHGTGLGSAMLRVAEADLPETVTVIELLTGLRSTANQRFYRRHGYAPAVTDEAAGTVVMRKQR